MKCEKQNLSSNKNFLFPRQEEKLNSIIMLNQKTLKQVGNSIIFISSGITFHSWYLSMQDHQLKKLITKYQEENTELTNKLLKISEERLLSEQAKNEFLDAANKELAHLKEIKAAMDSNNNASLTKLLSKHYSNYFNQNNQSTSQTFHDTANSHSSICQSLLKRIDESSKHPIQDAINSNNVNWNTKPNSSLNELARLVEKYSNSDSNSNSNFEDSTKFLDSIKSFIESYQEWLDMLNVYQKGAIAHILVSALIFSCVTSLALIYYSDALIKYFNLENKYSWLTKYIGLRRKLQQYYFFLNTMVIIIALIVLIFMNVFAFSVYSD